MTLVDSYRNCGSRLKNNDLPFNFYFRITNLIGSWTKPRFDDITAPTVVAAAAVGDFTLTTTNTKWMQSVQLTRRMSVDRSTPSKRKATGYTTLSTGWYFPSFMPFWRLYCHRWSRVHRARRRKGVNGRSAVCRCITAEVMRDRVPIIRRRRDIAVPGPMQPGRTELGPMQPSLVEHGLNQRSLI